MANISAQGALSPLVIPGSTGDPDKNIFLDPRFREDDNRKQYAALAHGWVWIPACAGMTEVVLDMMEKAPYTLIYT